MNKAVAYSNNHVALVSWPYDTRVDGCRGVAVYRTGHTTSKTEPKYAGKNVLICWHHGKIPKLVAALGVSNPPSPWPANVFDRVWQITFSAAGATLKDLPQSLLFGDTAI